MNPITLTHPELNASVRIIERDDQPWFVAKDVCDVLGISNSRDALSKLDDDEKGVARTDTLGGPQSLSIISESGLYALILRSDKAAARTFSKWVTSEVLPALRKDGFYASRLEPGERELLVLEYRIKAAKLREESRYWENKAAGVNLLPGAIPLYDWVVEQFPDLGHRQQANMTRQVKRDLLDLGLPVGVARGARKQLTALPADLAKLTPRALR